MGLSRQILQKMPATRFDVTVVDNDPLGSAREICQAAELPLTLKYVIEPRRGIAHVRNRALREADAADFIAFIDDDEVPAPEWLDELLWTQFECQADVVAGPVLPEYVGDIPGWIRRGGFFDRPEFPTGTQLEKCGAGNVLISREVFTRVPAFDERFQLTGGEDIQFFLQVHRAGFCIVWSQLAVAYEAVASDRANLKWILHRAYQSGNSWVLCELSFDPGHRVRVARFCKASAHLLMGLASALISIFLGKAAFAKSLRNALRGAGMLAALFGRRYLAYESAGVTPTEPTASLRERISA